MIVESPSAFFNPRDLHGVYSENFLLSRRVDSHKLVLDFSVNLSPIELYAVEAELFNFADNEFFLSFDDVTDTWVVDGGVDVALHHCSAFVVLDVAFPALSGHTVIFAEALLSEVA